MKPARLICSRILIDGRSSRKNWIGAIRLILLNRQNGPSMIENERNCVEIAHQINAVIAALRRVQGDMVRDHLTALAESSIAGKLPAAKARRLANAVGVLMARLG